MTPPASTTDLPAGSPPAPAIDLLTLEDKVRLLTGATNWSLHAVPEIGLRALVMSDGPVGVRGETNDPADWSLLFPAPSALSATWDPAAAHRLGRLFAQEARRKGVDVVLGPVVNLQRTPVGGRHFECYSEDPLLTGDIAAALIGSIQEQGVGACVKHYVANDAETDRTVAVSVVDERTLREVYLAPFERLVRGVNPWSVMAAYNAIDDGVQRASATEHRHLLTGVLKDEWGYDGVVVSDWLANTAVAESALAGLDVAMPGPGGPWAEHLLDAVRSGAVPESVIDDKVHRILLLAERVAALGADSPPAPARQDGPAVLRELGARSTVVLRNDDGLLPLDRSAVTSVALIGPNAVDPFVQGGGSAFVHPPHVVSPPDGLRAALPGVLVTVRRGGASTVHPPELDLGRAETPDGRPGLLVEILDAGGTVRSSQARTELPGGLRVDDDPTAHTIRITGRLRLAEPGRHVIEVGTVGAYRVVVGGVLVDIADAPAGAEVILDSSVNNPAAVPHVIDVTDAVAIDLAISSQVIDGAAYGRFFRVALRHALPAPTVDEEIAEAARAAAAADVAVVVVGTNPEAESEGWDRTTLALPGRQDELVRAVAAVNPRTIVMVNAGAPVLLPWLDEAGVGAVLWWWLPGQEAGHALADLLFGVTEPSGRLPWTLPARAGDVPVPDAVPVGGLVDYHEGIDVGHRGWDRRGLQPARPFGFGLGWTEWSYESLAPAAAVGDPSTVEVAVRNTGTRRGREVVQAYLEPAEPDESRPARWLAGSAVLDVDPGAVGVARIDIPRRCFETWDAAGHRWQLPSGGFRLRVGRSSRDLRLSQEIGPPTPS